MKLNFQVKVLENSENPKYKRFTIPADVCKKYSINLGDVFIIKIEKSIFPTTVSGNKYSKFIAIPINISDKLKLKTNRKIKISIKEKAILPKNQIKIKKFDNQEFLDLLYSLPKKQIHTNKELFIFMQKNKLLIFSKGPSKPIAIPRYIPLNENIFEFLGLYQAEGYKKLPKIGARLEFANSNPQIINIFMNCIENNFLIPKQKWLAYITYYNNDKQHETLVKYWNKKTNIPIKNFQKTRFFKGKTNRATENGTLHVLILSTVLAEIMLGMLNCAEKLIQRNKILSSSFLRGILAGDSHVKLTKWKNITTLQIIEIATENEKETELYKKILDKLSISYHDYSKKLRKINITHINNFDKLAKIDAFRLHPKKEKDFWKGYKEHTRANPNLFSSLK